MIKNPLITLALETTCDETSVAILKNQQIIDVLTKSQIPAFAKTGGVVPQIASELHVQYLPILIEQIVKQNKLKWNQIQQIAYAAKPGLSGCLQVAKNAAQTINLQHKIPLIPIDHVEAHYWIAAYQKTVVYPVLGLVVSGGHTHLAVVNKGFSPTVVGNTKDDAAGECLDKIARYLNLPYPGGPIIEKLAQTGRASYRLPVYVGTDLNFSFSGLKTFCVQLIDREKKQLKIHDFATSLETTIFSVIKKKVVKAVKKYKIKTILAGGGVLNNARLRKTLLDLNNIKVLLSPKQYCGDNAAMIGYLATRLSKKD